MQSFLSTLRIWWRPILTVAAGHFVSHGLSQMLQGATSELGQDAYGWVTELNKLAAELLSGLWGIFG